MVSRLYLIFLSGLCYGHKKILTLSIKLEGSRVISFDYLDKFLKNWAKTDEKLGFFGIEFYKFDFLFNFFIRKTFDFIPNMDDNFLCEVK